MINLEAMIQKYTLIFLALINANNLLRANSLPSTKQEQMKAILQQILSPEDMNILRYYYRTGEIDKRELVTPAKDLFAMGLGKRSKEYYPFENDMEIKKLPLFFRAYKRFPTNGRKEIYYFGLGKKNSDVSFAVEAKLPFLMPEYHPRMLYNEYTPSIQFSHLKEEKKNPQIYHFGLGKRVKINSMENFPISATESPDVADYSSRADYNIKDQLQAIENPLETEMNTKFSSKGMRNEMPIDLTDLVDGYVINNESNNNVPLQFVRFIPAIQYRDPLLIALLKNYDQKPLSMSSLYRKEIT